ncbi:hypothetical protein PtB15_2B271 [Puccinia triticina]|nr:hypothetical protein PtB15_2B271 [Puccinia triticina]
MRLACRDTLLWFSLWLISQGAIAPPTNALPQFTLETVISDLSKVQHDVKEAKLHFTRVGLDKHYKTRLDFLDQQIKTLGELIDKKYFLMSLIRGGKEASDHEHNRNGVKLGDPFIETERILSNFIILLTVFLWPEIDAYSRDREHHPFRKAIFQAVRLMLKHNLAQPTTVQQMLCDSVISRQLLRCGLMEDEMKSPPITLEDHDWESRKKSKLPTLFRDNFWYQMVQRKPHYSLIKISSASASNP